MHAIIVINTLQASVAESIKRLVHSGNLAKDTQIIILRHSGLVTQFARNNQVPMVVREKIVNYFDKDELARVMLPYKNVLIGVVSRSESSIQYLALLQEALADCDSIALPSADSLRKSSDKALMRQAFVDFDETITPSFIQSHSTEEALDKITPSLFPVIVKPSNLASSTLVQKCSNKDELQVALENIFTVIKSTYKKQGRFEKPSVVIEQLLQGALYSLDAYVARSVDDVTICPVTQYVSGNDIGFDDFFLYKRSAPTPPTEILQKELVVCVKKGIAALGLTNTTVNIELCHTKQGWKIIEIGPRVGRYRNQLYEYAYGMHHSDNDVAIRLGLSVVVNYDPIAHCGVYSIYPRQEGILKEIKGIDDLKNLHSLKYLRVLSSVGDRVYYAKNGGHPALEVIIAHSNKTVFDSESRWFEDNVQALTI